MIYDGLIWKATLEPNLFSTFELRFKPEQVPLKAYLSENYFARCYTLQLFKKGKLLYREQLQGRSRPIMIIVCIFGLIMYFVINNGLFFKAFICKLAYNCVVKTNIYIVVLFSTQGVYVKRFLPNFLPFHKNRF